MLNLRYIFRLIGAFVSRFKILIFIGIAFGVIIFFLLRFLAPLLFATRTARIGEAGRYTVATLPEHILNKIGNGLTRVEEDGSVVPDLASSWETTDKGKTWIFTLKDGLKWQDGKEVISEDINYQFSDVAIERPDDKTIIFKLQDAYSAFPSVVSRPTFKSGLLGTGDWKVTKISLNGSVVESLQLLNLNGEKTIYKFYPTEDGTKVAFELGQVDTIDELFSLHPFNTWPKVKVEDTTETGSFVAVFFNTTNSYLADKNIRQALSYAINKNELGGMRAISPISLDSWAYNPQVKTYNYDPVKAKDTISTYKKENNIGSIQVTLSTPPLLLDKAEQIVKDWQSAGIDANVQVISSVPTDYQAFLAIFDIPDDPDQYSIWHSTQTSTNITHYQNPRIDKLLEDGRSEIDLETRKKIYLDFQRYLVEDSPAAFLYYPTVYSVSRR